MKHLFLLSLVFAASHGSLAAQSDNYRGVELYRQGKFKEAYDALRYAVADIEGEKDPELWSYMGLSCLTLNDSSCTALAFQRAVGLRPENADYRAYLAESYWALGRNGQAKGEAEKALRIDPRNTTALMVRARAEYNEAKFAEAERYALEAVSQNDQRPETYLFASKLLMTRLGRAMRTDGIDEQLSLIGQAKYVVEKGLKTCKSAAPCSDLNAERSGLADLFEYASSLRSSGASHLLLEPSELAGPGVIPLKILSKSKPNYTDAARQRSTQGNVQLGVLFGANGTIAFAWVRKGLPNGLSEQAIEAAKKITFEPMKKDGKPVSVIKGVEYSFSAY